MTLDLHTVKEDFSVMVQKVQPWTLSQFVMWLDLKVAEYKVHGYMILDYESELDQFFMMEPKKPPSNNGPFTNAPTAPARPATSRNIGKQTSIINIDADSPPPPPTAPAQNPTTHLRGTNTQVIDVDLPQSMPSNSRNIQVLYARNSQPDENEKSIATINPSLGGYSMSKNAASSPATQYGGHNGQHANSLRMAPTHPRTLNSNHSQLVSDDNTIHVGSSRRNSSVSFSQHCPSSQQPAMISGGHSAGEQLYQNQSSIQHIDIDPNSENELSLVQIEPEMELLMDVECDNDYVQKNWNSSTALNIKDKQLLQDIKNGIVDNKLNNNPNNLEIMNGPIPKIKLEDGNHDDEDKSFALNIENSNSCNQLLNTEDCFQINDSDSDFECENNQDGLNDHVWSSEDSTREPSNLPQSNSKRRYMNHRMKPRISLPSFNGYLQNMLENGKAQFVWSKLVEQCAYHILAQKDIREKHDYREFCHALYQRYPSIGLEGPQPWSHFSKTLSQKIRHIRWQHKKRSTLGEGSKNTPPSGGTTATNITSSPSTTTASPSSHNPLTQTLVLTQSTSVCDISDMGGNDSVVPTTDEIKEPTTLTTQTVQKCEEV